MSGHIYVGVGGWTFEPWRGVFFPDGLAQKRELEYASRKLTAIDIAGFGFDIKERSTCEFIDGEFLDPVEYVDANNGRFIVAADYMANKVSKSASRAQQDLPHFTQSLRGVA